MGEYTWLWWMPEEMRSNQIFWMMNWYSSRVGGHFVFPTAIHADASSVIHIRIIPINRYYRDTKGKELADESNNLDHR